jgi:hypothetical protein
MKDRIGQEELDYFRVKDIKRFLKFMFFACSYCEKNKIEIGPMHPDYIYCISKG